MKGETTAYQGCAACYQPIDDQFIYKIDPDLHYHAACLSCSECQRSLIADPTCRVRNGQLFCRADYDRLFAMRCARCSVQLTGVDYVIRAAARVYHAECFRCCACARVLASGEQCVIHDQGPFCRADSELLCQHAGLLSPPDTNNCSINASSKKGFILAAIPVTDDRLTVTDVSLSLDSDHDRSCVQLTDPSKQLSIAAETNFSLGKSVTSTTSINLATCFPDSPSSQTGSSDYSVSAHKSHSNRASASTLRSPSSTVMVKSCKKSRKSHNAAHEKPSRIRTVLSEKQLHTLRACYAANPRPDALMKDQLVEMTGLSPRVIRVWFQNKRCKDKKRSILLKQLREQEQNGGQQRSALMHATPLIASTAIMYDASSIDSAVEIQPCCFNLANVAC